MDIEFLEKHDHKTFQQYSKSTSDIPLLNSWLNGHPKFMVYQKFTYYWVKLSMMKQPTRGMITAHLGQPYHDV